MSVLEIILAITNVAFGGGFFFQLVTLRQMRNEADTRVDKGNVELASTSVSEMLRSVNSLMQQNRELIEIKLKADDENENLKKKVDGLIRRVDKMQRAVKEVLTALEKLNVDDELLKPLREQVI
jgi:predicted RNase H-like nuclease (RuvC/YqgF family)